MRNYAPIGGLVTSFILMNRDNLNYKSKAKADINFELN